MSSSGAKQEKYASGLALPVKQHLTSPRCGSQEASQIKEDLKISDYGNVNYSTMTKESANTLKGYSNIKSISPNVSPKGVSDPNNPVFPSKYPIGVLQDRKLPDYKWNVDNFGPIIIPKKGWTVKLDGMTFPLYERCIEVYENNKVEISGNDILINVM